MNTEMYQYLEDIKNEMSLEQIKKHHLFNSARLAGFIHFHVVEYEDDLYGDLFDTYQITNKARLEMSLFNLKKKQ
jgi:hypothetical protein